MSLWFTFLLAFIADSHEEGKMYISCAFCKEFTSVCVVKLLFVLSLFTVMLLLLLAVIVLVVIIWEVVPCTLHSIDEDNEDEDWAWCAFGGVLVNEIFFSGMIMVLAGVVFYVVEDVTAFASAFAVS